MDPSDASSNSMMVMESVDAVFDRFSFFGGSSILSSIQDGWRAERLVNAPKVGRRATSAAPEWKYRDHKEISTLSSDISDANQNRSIRPGQGAKSKIISI